MSDRLHLQLGPDRVLWWAPDDGLVLQDDRLKQRVDLSPHEAQQLARFITDGPHADDHKPVCPRCGTPISRLKGHVGSARCRRLRFQRQIDKASKAMADKFTAVPAHEGMASLDGEPACTCDESVGAKDQDCPYHGRYGARCPSCDQTRFRHPDPACGWLWSESDGWHVKPEKQP